MLPRLFGAGILVTRAHAVLHDCDRDCVLAGAQVLTSSHALHPYVQTVAPDLYNTLNTLRQGKIDVQAAAEAMRANMAAKGLTPPIQAFAKLRERIRDDDGH